MYLNPEQAAADVEWRTGTAIDEFTPIYRALGKGVAGGRYGPAEVDAMDLTLVALLVGVGADPGAGDMAELQDMARRLAAGEDVSWE